MDEPMDGTKDAGTGRDRSTSDWIDIEDLSIRTYIGIFPQEKDRKQEVILNLRLFVDMRRAGRSDSIDDAVDYKSVTKGIIALVESARFDLLEALAERIAAWVLDGSAISRLTLRVEKPGALRHARTVAVTIHRSQGDTQ